MLAKGIEEFSHAGNSRYVLACIFKDNDLFYDAEALLGATSFLEHTNRNIFTVLRNLAKQNIKFDINAILAEAVALNLEMEKDIGGIEYLNSVFDTIVSLENFEIYLGKVKDASTKKKLYVTLKDSSSLVVDNSQSSEYSKSSNELISIVEERILNIAMENDNTSDAMELGNGVEEYVESRKQEKLEVLGLRTGFDLLDKALNGLKPGSLTVVAARPKRGKSMLLQSWARDIVYKQKKPIFYVDTEMLFEEVRSRLLANLSGVKERDITNGLFVDDLVAVRNVQQAVDTMEKGQFYHKYFPAFTAERIASMARKYKVKYDIQALFFDYIKLPESSSLNDAKEYQHLGFLATTLKNLAGELNIPVITAVQISRAGVDKDIITTGMVADSDRIVRYANTILALTVKSEEDEINDVPYRVNASLQILDTRSGTGVDWDGLDLWILHSICKVTQAGSTFNLSELLPRKAKKFDEKEN